MGSGITEGGFNELHSYYGAALAAYDCLLNKTNFIGNAKWVLERLIRNLPLTKIEDEPEVWDKVFESEGKTWYQCNRYFYLFKAVRGDGTIEYNDNSRVIAHNSKSPSFINGAAFAVIDELFPIKMPYFPYETPFRVYVDEYLSNPENGCEYADTAFVRYFVDPEGNFARVDRYFKCDKNDSEWVEIPEFVFAERTRGSRRGFDETL